jgi:hypothetical protein
MASRKATAFSRDKMLRDSEALARLRDVFGSSLKLAQYELHGWLLDGLPAWEGRIRISGPPVFRPIERDRWLVVTPECLGGRLGVEGPLDEDEDPSDLGPAECYCFVDRRLFERLFKALCSVESQQGEKDNETYEVIRAIVNRRNPKGYGRKSTAALRRQVLRDFKQECEDQGLDPGNDPEHPSWDTVARALGRRED